jgi:hypothetical protein
VPPKFAKFANIANIAKFTLDDRRPTAPSQ